MGLLFANSEQSGNEIAPLDPVSCNMIGQRVSASAPPLIFNYYDNNFIYRFC